MRVRARAESHRIGSQAGFARIVVDGLDGSPATLAYSLSNARTQRYLTRRGWQLEQRWLEPYAVETLSGGAIAFIIDPAVVGLVEEVGNYRLGLRSDAGESGTVLYWDVEPPPPDQPGVLPPSEHEAEPARRSPPPEAPVEAEAVKPAPVPTAPPVHVNPPLPLAVTVSADSVSRRSWIWIEGWEGPSEDLQLSVRDRRIEAAEWVRPEAVKQEGTRLGFLLPQRIEEEIPNGSDVVVGLVHKDALPRSGLARWVTAPPVIVNGGSSGPGGSRRPLWLGAALAAVLLGAVGVIIAMRRDETTGPEPPPPPPPPQRASPCKQSEGRWPAWMRDGISVEEGSACLAQWAAAGQCDDADFAAEYVATLDTSSSAALAAARHFEPGGSDPCEGSYGLALKWARKALERGESPEAKAFLSTLEAHQR